MKTTEFRKLVREEVRKMLNAKTKTHISESILDKLKGMFGQAKKEAPEKSTAGKKIIGVDWDGRYIDEDGNIVG